MNKNAYTKQKFEKALENPKQLERLLGQLEKDIEKEVDNVLREKLAEIASILQTVGHKLKPNHKLDDLGSIDFNDEETTDSNPGLWFTCLPVVSVDYSSYNKEKSLIDKGKS